MTAFEWFQTIAITGGLIFVAVQSWLMRRAVQEQRNQLRVQSCLQVWQAHIQVCHLPVATGSEEIAVELNKMTPYHALDINDARRAHFADTVFDLYESITLMTDLGILEADVARVWKNSIPYEMRNASLREHWQRYHQPSGAAQDVYLRKFADLVRDSIRHHEAGGLTRDQSCIALQKDKRSS
jgi:hypothetical protein